MMSMRKIESIDVLALLLMTLGIVLLFTRLTDFPVFVDEAVHLWWVQRILTDGEWLRSLNVGKPLEAWLPIPMVALGVEPLLVMRALHAGAAVLVIFFSYRLGALLLHRDAGMLVAALTLLSPFFVFYARLALTEVYLALGYLLVLYASIKFHQDPSRQNTLLLAFALVLSAFAKFPVGFIALAVVPIAIVILDGRQSAQFFHTTRSKLFLAYFPTCALLMGVVSIALWRRQQALSPGFGFGLVERQTVFTGPLIQIAENARILVGLGVAWWTGPIFTLSVMGILAGVIFGGGHLRWLAIVTLAPLLIMLMTASEWHSRYLLFLLAPLTVISISGWLALLKQWFGSPILRRRIAQIMSISVLIALTSRTLVLYYDSLLFHWPDADRREYVSQWPSGFGFSEAAEFLEHDPPSTILVLEIGAAKQLEVYLPNTLRDRVYQIQLTHQNQPLTLTEQCTLIQAHSDALLLNTRPLDLAIEESCLSDLLEEVARFQRPLDGEPVVLYRIN